MSAKTHWPERERCAIERSVITPVENVGQASRAVFDEAILRLSFGEPGGVSPMALTLPH